MGARLNTAFPKFLQRFRRVRNGNVALIFALTALPLAATVGGAIDFGIALSNKSSLQDASDAAALAGAKAASNYISQNGTTAAQIALATQVGNTTAQQFFTTNVGAVGNETTPTISTTTTINSNAPTVVTTVSGNYTPYLLSLIGINSIPISVTSTTTLSPSNSYYQIVFVVDVSGSMGIGADSTTTTNMTNAAGMQCAFACHETTDWQGVTATNWCDSNPSDYFCLSYGPSYCPWGNGNCPIVQSATWANTRNIAKLYGFKLKIDYVNSAISSFMSQLSSYSSNFPGRFTVSIDTFGSNINNAGLKFFQLQTPTTNMTTATNAANTIDIEVAPPNTGQIDYTYTTSGLASALGAITNMGDGSSPTKMLTYVIFLTDGVEDVYNASALWNRQIDFNYTSECTALKNAGVNIFSIWATYPVMNNAQYNGLIAPVASQIAPAVQSCASSANQYFQADDGPGISAAVNSTFNTIVANSKLRITK